MLDSQTVPRNGQSLVAVGLVLGLVLSALDQTIVTTAMPTIARQLGGLSLFGWVFAAYMLLETSATPLFGKLAYPFERRRVYLAGMLFFAGRLHSMRPFELDELSGASDRKAARMDGFP